jgi:ATP-dependent exoDNAse (exonuclease V) beta subunit
LLAVVCDPENAFEWFGVLREVFGVSDALLAVELKERGAFQWETPEVHPEPLRGALAALRPWILRANDEGLALGPFAEGLSAACALPEKARALDGQGESGESLERLLGDAEKFGLDGFSPRSWLNALLAGRERACPSGKPQADAVNLLSSHSAKGLEWPVVIPLGFWRAIGERPQHGLYLVSEAGPRGTSRVFFNQSSMPAEAREARERERLRELVRLLYVTLTRARRRLVIPWNGEFGGRKRSDPSFADLWGAGDLLDALPRVDGVAPVPSDDFESTSELIEKPKSEVRERLAPYPRRLLPHQLAQKPDLSRGHRHESSLDQAAPSRISESDEAIDYGIWWHETMEFMPWRGDDSTIDAYCTNRLVVASEHGFFARAKGELERLRASQIWSELCSGRCEWAAELAVFSPLEARAWIDGVIDLVLHDIARREVWVVDWKTNRQRPGENAGELLARLAVEYAPQLRAYGKSIWGLFPEASVRLLIYSSVIGDWVDIKAL